MNSDSMMLNIQRILDSHLQTNIRIICDHFNINFDEALRLVTNQDSQDSQDNKDNKDNKDNQNNKTVACFSSPSPSSSSNCDVISTTNPVSNLDLVSKQKSTTKNKLVLEIELPFSGIIDENRCKGIRSAGKLYTQCLFYVNNETKYCKKCQNEADKNESKEPNHGNIYNRANVGLYEFKDKDGKTPWPYYKLMKKKGWTKEFVLNIAKKHNIVISNEHFNDSKMNMVCQKKCSKAKAKAKAKKIINKCDNEQLNPFEPLEFEGTSYLRSKSTNLICNPNSNITNHVMGIWVPADNRINFNYEIDDYNLELIDEIISEFDCYHSLNTK